MQVLVLETRFVAMRTVTAAPNPDYPGSGWRGALGHALRRLDPIAYRFLFESPLADKSANGLHGSNAPHPFVLFPVNWQGANYPQLADLRLVLIGTGIRYAEVLHKALVEAAANGIHGLAYEAVAGEPQLISLPHAPSAPKKMLLSLQSPMRLRQAKSNVTPAGFNPEIFLSTLLRRHHQLSVAYEPQAASNLNYLCEQTGQMEFAKTSLFWKDGERFSSRQNSKVPLGGIMGAAIMQWEAPPDLWSLLWLGQWLHLGKGAVMGLGSYQLTPVT